MKLIKYIALGLIVFFIVIAVSITHKSLKLKSQVKEMFKLNKTLQEEGYYMGDFEFKLLGMGYYLHLKQYRKAQTMLSDYHTKLINKEGLIKIPEFKNNQEEIDFFLQLQNPKTGAFIDETAPFCVYYEVSKNIIDHIVSLTDSTTKPLKLNYPLSFLDSINTPRNLVEHLNDISYVGWMASQFPQTTFHFARNILGATRSENTFEAYNLYTFSPEWKHAMLKWMCDFQDTTSGMWGPRSRRTHKIIYYDLNNTKSIVKNYRNKLGKNLHEEFPLQYANKLFKSSVEQLSEPYPDKDELAEIHEWNLRQAKGLSMLLEYLWNDATSEDKKNAEQIIERNIDICFRDYYVEEEGAFSYYPNSKKASPDGISNLIFDEIGAFSYKKQKKLWGAPEETIKDMGEVILYSVNTSAMEAVINVSNINSLRIYNRKPNCENLTDNVWAVFYPKDTPVLDVMELVPNIVNWTETSSLSMGNWISMARIEKKYSKLNIKKPIILRDELPIKDINEVFNASGELYFIGFDKLQIPRYSICYKLSR